MKKINAKSMNILVLIATVYAGGIRGLFDYLKADTEVILMLVQAIGIAAIFAGAYFIKSRFVKEEFCITIRL